MRRRPSRKWILIIFSIIVFVLIFSSWSRTHYDQPALQRFYNRLGERGTDMDTFYYFLALESEEFQKTILSTFDLEKKLAHDPPKQIRSVPDQINLVVVACGDRVEEGITMVKSAVLMSQDAYLNVIAFSDYDTMPELGKQLLLLKWESNQVGIDFRFELRKTWFPPEAEKTWRKMWRPCATQRLFLTSLLPEYDSVIYIDTDVIFISSLIEFWNHFLLMDSQQFASMVANDEMPGMGWYNLHSKIPYYGDRGLNAGIAHMNLTRMRNFGFESAFKKIYTEYESGIFLADQDILNIFFNLHPEYLLELPCTENFRSSHCDCEHDGFTGDGCRCKSVEETGVSIVHGNQLTFQEPFRNHDYVFLRNLYSSVKKHKMTTPLKNLYEELSTDFLNIEKKGSPCFDLNVETMYGNLRRYIQSSEVH